MSTLTKAKLLCVEGGAPPIIFMFNPNELKFSEHMNLNPSEGSQSKEGLTKISFANPAPCTLTISNIIINTYEGNDSVMVYLEIFKQSVRFAKSGAYAQKRPPVYIFMWGENEPLRCFVESLDYSVTMFKPNGTPVRAKVNLTLKEVDKPTSSPSMSASSEGQRGSDTPDSRSGK